MEGRFIAFETKAFYKLLEELFNMVSSNQALQNKAGSKEWLNSEEAKALLGIKSNGKLKSLVERRSIDASQHGRTIMYCKASILKFLENHKLY